MSAPATCVVFGEALVDVFEHAFVVGGAPLNVARHLAAFGLAPTMISRVGQDALADTVREAMNQSGLSQAALQVDPQHPTGRVKVWQAPDGGHSFSIEHQVAYDYISAAQAMHAMQKATASAASAATTWLYHGTLALRAAESYNAWQALTQNQPTRRYVDLNWRGGHTLPARCLAAMTGASWIKLSQEELVLVLSWLALPTNVLAHRPANSAALQIAERSVLAQLMQRLQCQHLCVTYGAQGAAVFDRVGNCVESCPSVPPAQMVDTVGAGDAFSTIMLAGQMLGWSTHDCVSRACEFASAICAVRGAVPQDSSFYAPFKQRWAM